MQPFNYLRPGTIDEALAALAAGVTSEELRRTRPLGGGTTLVDLMKMGVETPKTLIDITAMSGFDRIEGNAEQGLSIGALARMSDVAEHPTVRNQFPALCESLVKAASVQLRNMATVGGNLLQRTRCAYFRSPEYACNKRAPGSGCPARNGLHRGLAILGVSDQCIANYPGDWAVALAAFDARLILSGLKGERQVPIAEFFLLPGQTPDRETVIEPGELITRILVPPCPTPWASAYEKVCDRESYAFALASAAVALHVEDGLIRRARIAIGGLATVPWRLREAESALIGCRPDEESASKAVEASFADARTTSQNAFRVPLGKAVTVNAILIAAKRTGREPRHQTIQELARSGAVDAVRCARVPQEEQCVSASRIGSDQQRVDGRNKVLGHPIFAADRSDGDLLYGATAAATIGKGKIIRLDVSEAERSPGVVRVLTYLNMDRLKPATFNFAGGTGTQTFQPMQSDVIPYRGQPIALVIADTFQNAIQAAKNIRVEYHTETPSVLLHSPGGETVQQSKANSQFEDIIAGDFDKALEQADVVVDEVFTAPPQHHNPLELLSTVAQWDGDKLLVREGSQAAGTLRSGLAGQIGIPESHIRVLSPFVGGAFGHRGGISFHTVLAAVASRQVGRPLKLVIPRDQMFHSTLFRSATEHRITLGARHNGQIVACAHLPLAQTSRFDLSPFTGAETTSRMYNIPNFRGVASLVKLDTYTPGFMRAPFEMSSFFALESALDELAYKLGFDPVELRILNDTDRDPITRKPFSLRRLNECLLRGSKQFGWKERNPEPRSMRSTCGALMGWGVAAGAYPGMWAPATARISLQLDGTANLSVSGHEMGQGIRTTAALIASHGLGIPPESVNITMGDSSLPPQGPTAGSWGTATLAPAIHGAACAVRDRTYAMAAAQRTSFAQVQAKDCELVDGNLRCANDIVAVRELMEHAGVQHVDGHSSTVAPGQNATHMKKALQGLATYGGPEFPDFLMYSYGAHFVEVHVDIRTMKIRVERIVSILDCGRVISRRTAISQAYGGQIWGISAALSEGSEPEPNLGGFLNNNLADYQFAVNADVRNLEVDFIDEPDTVFSSIGAKGLGEIASVGVAAAIANAVYHATGKRVRSLPIRADNLLS